MTKEIKSQVFHLIQNNTTFYSCMLYVINRNIFWGHELDVRGHTEEEQRNILFTKDNPD